MCGRYALYGPISRQLSRVAAFLLVVGGELCSAQTYSAFDPPNNSAISGVPRLSIHKANGSVLAAPKVPDQVGFSDVKISTDGHRIGWLALMPNCCTSYAVPLKLIIFRGDKIERVIDEGICVFGWTFESKGAEVAYFVETLHTSTGKEALLRDIASGKQLGSVRLQRDAGGDVSGLENAPAWVREIPHIED